MYRLLLVLAAIFVMALAAAAIWLYTPDRDRSGLEAEYAGPPSSFIEATGLRLHVRDTGPRDAPALILLHGFGASLLGWNGLADRLQDQFRVIRFDLPGFGLTGPDPSGDYSDRRAMAVLAALMDRLGIARATVVGHSMGGRIAWRFAAEHPERVEKLVLIAPDGFASPGLAYGVAPEVPLVMRLLPYVLPAAMLRQTLQAAYADPSAMTGAVLASTRDMLLAPGVRRAILARTAQTVLADPEPLLRRIEAPTLLLWGQRDAMVPFSNAADYQRNLPHATLVAFPEAGHLPQAEWAPAVAQAIRKFVAKQV